jgi:endogenous inhibitor of DNA gyrase (YacG/DUF329 family)
VTALIIEHSCPQCGAPVELEETDRLIRCGFCRVASVIDTSDFFRYVIPHRAENGKPLIYFPYWRFKGMLFSCLAKKIEQRFVDVSHQAFNSPYFPPNIGSAGRPRKFAFWIPTRETPTSNPISRSPMYSLCGVISSVPRCPNPFSTRSTSAKPSA